MSSRVVPGIPLSDLSAGQEADFFAVLSLKEEHTTRDGKPYTRVGFRDARREVQFPVWADSPWAADCRERWQTGEAYKLRAVYRESSYGGQLEIRKIRAVTDADRAEGFDPLMLLPRSRHDPAGMLGELSSLVEERIADAALRRLVLAVLDANRAALLVHPASLRNHHAYVGGFLEHAVSVTRTAVFLADKYASLYPDLEPPLDKDLVVAGAILHDIGKLRDVEPRTAGAVRTVYGSLLGHVVLGRDMLREFAAQTGFDGERLLRLEHILVSHELDAERGGIRPPMTPEALLVQAADAIDTQFHIMATALAADASAGPLTTAKNLLQRELFRGQSK